MVHVYDIGRDVRGNMYRLSASSFRVGINPAQRKHTVADKLIRPADRVERCREARPEEEIDEKEDVE